MEAEAIVIRRKHPQDLLIHLAIVTVGGLLLFLAIVTVGRLLLGNRLGILRRVRLLNKISSISPK